ncbi:hypothetical protein IH601_06180 [Candidatus Bipolaricaulota bacterium]|nr:hypothetical protein [Candidatus Bipolaricaulota bacterium]TFH11167.1 MAG: hypothetical protein E4H08_01995 [Candidatus Atribacteria bacterium]
MSEREDTAKTHEKFSVQCFNSAWELLDRIDRSLAEDEEMLRLSITSIWHWTQRSDCTNQNLAMGYWQVSRIHAVQGRADEARRYGELCLAASVDKKDDQIAPFMLAYAYEALARAESAASEPEKRDHYVAEARKIAETICDPDTLKMLLDDLATIL